MKDSMIGHDGCKIVDYNRFFEWWYFDFDLQNGRSVHVEWHAPVFNSRGKSCVLVVRSHSPRKVCQVNEPCGVANSITKIYRYSRSLVTQKETFCDIEFPGGTIKERDGDYFIDISEKDLFMNLHLQRKCPPVSVEEEILYHVNDTNESFYWSVPLPRAYVEGGINLDGNAIEVEGESYHDHNWGNLHISRYLNGWIWGRVFFKHFVLIFGVISSKDKGEEKILYLVNEAGNQIRTKSLFIQSRGAVKDERGGSEIPKELWISFVDNARYTVHIESMANLMIEEFPLGSFNNHQVNSILASSYYLLKLNYAPSIIKKLLGRGFYFRLLTRSELFVDDQLTDRGEGKMEVFVFGT